eukprot:1142366-Pelagomonas_calceolata.AAC.2
MEMLEERVQPASKSERPHLTKFRCSQHCLMKEGFSLRVIKVVHSRIKMHAVAAEGQLVHACAHVGMWLLQAVITTHMCVCCRQAATMMLMPCSTQSMA